ncbi:hypothetical protein [Burkholderia pseudomallei]|uniref:hypothetical protein n=1 Tax=Burkholderia pseudomallei TaxID=28450 RepID=UPI000A1A10D6|nr:hypothetical protein [Burkholderia pseudomallei]ARK56271.1 hypothetical protein BOC36_24695 [Burkholderia pseudomallei]ARL25453.1 hypothetical protein BOC47_24070 [Burkholderia pseudomallei]
MHRNLYVLDGKEPRHARSVMEWGTWFATADRCVAATQIDDIVVSTVFIGIDHEFSPHGTRYHGAPMLFETAIFAASEVVRVLRYPTWDEAAKGHAFIVECIQDAVHRRRLDPNQAIDEAQERWLQRGVDEHGNAS